METKRPYLKYFFFGSLFGLIVTCAGPKSFADYVGHGASNIFIYGGIGYAVFAIKNKEFKKLWSLLLFFFLAFVTPILAIGIVSMLIFR
jgi:hypothetical protein